MFLGRIAFVRACSCMLVSTRVLDQIRVVLGPFLALDRSRVLVVSACTRVVASEFGCQWPAAGMDMLAALSNRVLGGLSPGVIRSPQIGEEERKETTTRARPPIKGTVPHASPTPPMR